MIDTILVIGNGGSGKSIMVWYLSSLLTESGYEIEYLSDRLGLEKGILKDTKHARIQKDGSKVGLHGKLIADGPPGHRKVHVLDGSILNRVHDELIASITKKRKSGVVLIIEYATGSEIDFGSGKEPLRQTADQLVDFVRLHKVRDSIFVIDLHVPVAIRQVRQSHRPDAMAPETFEAYFGDGGEISVQQRAYLGDHYHLLQNLEEDNEAYYSEVRHVYETLVRPKLGTETI